MRRELGSFERAQALTGKHGAYNVVLVLRVEGEPARDLETVLATLQARHPLLAARLVEEGGVFAFEAGDGGPIPLRRLPRVGDDDWRRVAEAELGFRFEVGQGPLARCAWITAAGAGPAEIVLTLHHVIVDAVAALRVARELLDEWGNASHRSVPREPEPSLPIAPDGAFPARWRGAGSLVPLAGLALRQLADEAGYRWRTGRHPPPGGAARCRLLSADLPAAATAALVRACRRRRLTVNHTLSAALLVAVQRRRHGGRALPMRYFAFPDLRPYLEPPVGPEVVGGYLTTMRFTVHLHRDQRLWDLAAAVQAQFLGAARRGEKFLWARLSPVLMRAGLRRRAPRMGDAAVSYSGLADFETGPGPPRLRDLHAFVSLFPQAPEIAAQARLYRRRIRSDFVYQEADMDDTEARGVAAEMLAALSEAARVGG